MSSTELQFAVLSSLSSGRKHGYAIVQEAMSFLGKPKLPLTTVYSSLEVLAERELITPVGDEIVNGRARRYFELTEIGLEELSERLTRQAAQVAMTRSRLRVREASLTGVLA